MKKSILLIVAACLATTVAQAAPKVQAPKCTEFTDSAIASLKVAKDVTAARQRMQPHGFGEHAAYYMMRFWSTEYQVRENISQFLHLGHAPMFFTEALAVSYMVNFDLGDTNLSLTKVTAQDNALYASTLYKYCMKG